MLGVFVQVKDEFSHGLTTYNYSGVGIQDGGQVNKSWEDTDINLCCYTKFNDIR